MRKGKFIISLICILILGNVYSQNEEDLIFEFYQSKQNLLPGQYLDRIILLRDSTYISESYQGEKDYSKDNLDKWEVTRTKGIWYFEKKTLILKQEDLIGRYKTSENYIKRRRIQYGHDGGKVLWYQKWIFEKRAKYKLVQ